MNPEAQELHAVLMHLVRFGAARGEAELRQLEARVDRALNREAAAVAAKAESEARNVQVP
jgi:hypothetical protein